MNAMKMINQPSEIVLLKLFINTCLVPEIKGNLHSTKVMNDEIMPWSTFKEVYFLIDTLNL